LTDFIGWLVNIRSCSHCALHCA